MREFANNYDASHIKVLEDLEVVRKRPAMYIGDTSIKGLHHLVSEVVDNCIDEALAGYCHNIQVEILPGNHVRVVDDSRCITADKHQKEKRSALEVVMTVVHAGGKHAKNTYKVSSGLHGVGVCCANTLSDQIVAEVRRQGHVRGQEYALRMPETREETIENSNVDDYWIVPDLPSTDIEEAFIGQPRVSYDTYSESEGVPIIYDPGEEKKRIYDLIYKALAFLIARRKGGGSCHYTTPSVGVPIFKHIDYIHLLIPRIFLTTNTAVANQIAA